MKHILLAFALLVAIAGVRAAETSTCSSANVVPVTYAFKNICLEPNTVAKISADLAKITDMTEPNKKVMKYNPDSNTIFLLVESGKKAWAEDYLKAVDVFPGQSAYKVVDTSGHVIQLMQIDGKEVVYALGEEIPVDGSKEPVFVGTKVTLVSNGNLTSYSLLVRKIVGYHTLNNLRVPSFAESSAAGAFAGNKQEVGGFTGEDGKATSFTIERTPIDTHGQPVKL